MKKIIILMGVPGSGKGTQATMLCDRFNYAHISTGELLRALKNDQAAGTDHQEKLAAMASGQLVSNDLIYTLAFGEIKKQLDAGRGVVLDGAIRSVEQAKAYGHFFAAHAWQDDVLVLEIAISDDETLRRVASRIASGRGRPDDAPEVVRERIAAQGNAAIRPILEHYKALGVLNTVDGLQSVDEVAARIQEIITT